MLVLVLVLAGSDKAPFDLIEAESEVVDGTTVDVGGIVFSLVFSSETAYYLFSCLLLGLHASLVTIGLVVFTGTLLIGYVGRCVLARVTIADAYDWTCYLFI